MSTSLLYHAFGIRGYEYTRTRYEGGAVIFSIRQGRETVVARPAARPDHPPRPGHAPLPIPAHRRPGDLRGPAHPPRRMPGLWRRPPGRGPLRRPAAELHSLVREYALELWRRMTIRDVAVISASAGT